MHFGSKSIVFSFVLVTFALLLSHTEEAHAQSMVVRMHGTGEARLADPSMGEPEESFCFDVLLENVSTGENIEMGRTDCLFVIDLDSTDNNNVVDCVEELLGLSCS